jgi:hypothetical protein
MIAVRDLSIGYEGVVLLRGLTFDVPAGDVFIILGERIQTEHLTTSRFHEIAAQIIEVNALHD